MNENQNAGNESLALSVAQRVDAACDRFARAWEEEGRPRLEDYLADMPAGERLALLRELVPLEAACRRQAGDEPRPEDYAGRFPELDADWLAQALAPLPDRRRASPPNAEEATRPQRFRCPHCHNPIERTDRHADVVLCPGCGSSFLVQDARQTSTSQPMRPLGKFQLLARVGLGAFGAVWKARDTELDRIVALKIPHTGLVTEGAQRERFRREARAAAQLRHPHIVTVHEVVELDGLPAIVSDFVEGVPLKELIEGKRLTFRETATLLATVADAVDYAHGMGLVHRDLKPANIMVEFGRPGLETVGSTGAEPGRPLVMDFGLALRNEAEVTMTQDGVVLGTPAYMSPEQAAGYSHQADARSDVYSLGVILYELLTGELPFRGSKAMLLHQVLREEPRPPRKLNDKVPRDLETICLKAMAKAPARRYASGRELAEDLRRWLKGEPIQARPVGRLERAARWVRRNPVVSALFLIVVMVFTAGTALSTYFAVQADTRARDAEREKERADRQANEAGENARRARAEQVRADAENRMAQSYLYAARMTLLQRAMDNHDVAQAIELFDAQRPERTGGRDLRGFEWFYWQRRCPANRLILKAQSGCVTSVVFSPDGKRLASSTGTTLQPQAPGAVNVWDAVTGGVILTLKKHEKFVRQVCFSPDGRLLASASEDRTVRVWDAATGRELHVLRHRSAVRGVAFSPDGQSLASAAADGTVTLWAVPAGREVRSLAAHRGEAMAVSFSPDGRHLASAGTDRAVKIWDLNTGKVGAVLSGHTAFVGAVCHSPDGRRLASAGGDGTVRVWDAETGREQSSLWVFAGRIMAVCFSPDGKRLACAALDRTARVWDVATGQELFCLKGHQTPYMWGVAFRPDGRRLATCNYDQTIKIWELPQAEERVSFQGHTGEVRDVAFHPAGRYAASAGYDRTVRIWEVATGREVRVLRGHTERINNVAFSPDGKLLASGSFDHTAKVWRWAAGKEVHTLRGHEQTVYTLRFSPDGRLLATGSRDHTVKLWDVETGAEVRTFRGHAREVNAVAFSPDGKLLASASFDHTVVLWDPATGAERLRLRGHDNGVMGVCFNPDGRRLASASWDTTVRIWDTATGTELLTLLGHSQWVYGVCFSPDGRRLVSGSTDGTVKVWDAAIGQELLTLKGHADGVSSVAFSPDGHRLASASIDRTIEVWDATPLDE